MKQFETIKNIYDELKDNPSVVTIYGAGKIGKSLVFALSEMGIENDKIRIMVSNNHVNESAILGIKISEIQDVKLKNDDPVIIAVMPNNTYFDNMVENASLYTSNLMMFSESLCQELEKKYDNSNTQNSTCFRTLKEKYPQQEIQIHNNRYRESIQFEVHLTEHCNLNCKGCFHFSPLAQEEYLDVEEYRKDCNRLSELYDKKARYVMLLGGEPLLHPQINEFMKISRCAFPSTELFIVTNGLLLKNMSESFWLACKEYSVIISATKYPINIDYIAAENKAQQYDVEFRYFNDSDDEKMLSFQPMDPKGNQPMEDNFYGCYRADECITLSHGRLYTCIMPAHLHHLNDYFNLNMPDFTTDGIDIYKVNDSEEIDRHLIKPIKACAYCDRMGCIDGNEYELSKRDINEWIKASV